MEPISILRYKTGVASMRSRVNLQQNLFSFLLEGEKTVYYAGAKVTIHPGQFLLLSAGNCLMSEKTAEQPAQYRSILLFFETSLLADFFSRFAGASQTKTGDGPREPGESLLVFEKDAFLYTFLESLGQLLDAVGPVSVNMRQIKLYELLLYLGERYPGQLQTLRDMSRQADDEMAIRQAVTANIDNPVGVEELAFLCNMSLSTFKRRFAKVYGGSPNKWLLEKRMEKAARLLKQGDCKVSEIYYEIGYDNLSSFIQSFKQVYGVTPKQYQLTMPR